MEPLIFLAALGAVFWFLLIRPQRQRQSKHRSMLADLSAGDEVITAGGVFATRPAPRSGSPKRPSQTSFRSPRSRR